jgi:hypothetical protein
MEVVVTGHNFESILPKDHPCHVCFKLTDWFQKRRLLNNFPIGFLKPHNRFESNLVEMFIVWSYTRFLFLALIQNPTWLPGQFDSNLLCGFRKKDENVKFP